MNPKDDFLCKICQKIRKCPVFLPCHCSSICKEHVDTMQTTTCAECHKSFDLSNGGLKRNKLMQQLINQNAHLNDNEKRLKLYLEESIRDSNSLAELCDDIIRQLPVSIYNRFEDMRRDIDIKRETVLQVLHTNNYADSEMISAKIQRYSADLIQQV